LKALCNVLLQVFTFVKYRLPSSVAMQETGQQRLERINKAIESSEQNVRQVISAVAENYKNCLSANVTYHLQLRDMAEQAGDIAGMMHQPSDV
jgi:CII-binding regulator of phage lambda lysogenization HflD